MSRAPIARRRPLIWALLPALAFGGCGTGVSTSGFQGEAHAVAQTVANLQSDASASDEGKICANDLAATLVSRLGGAGGCRSAIKDQLAEVDNLQLEVNSIKISGRTATAVVKSTYGGKKQVRSVTLVKEAGKWRISGLQ